MRLGCRVLPDGVDQLPIGTFLIGHHSAASSIPATVMRVVKPRVPDYPASYLTPGSRLLYYFWRSLPDRETGWRWEAIKRLGQGSVSHYWTWSVTSDETEAYAKLEAFKIACDHRRGKTMRPTLLYQALGLDLSLIRDTV